MPDLFPPLPTSTSVITAVRGLKCGWRGVEQKL